MDGSMLNSGCRYSAGVTLVVGGIGGCQGGVAAINAPRSFFERVAVGDTALHRAINSGIIGIIVILHRARAGDMLLL